MDEPEQPPSRETEMKPGQPIPIVPATLLPALVRTVSAIVLGSAVLVAAGLWLADRPDWWAGYWPATVIAILGGIAAIAVLSRAAGRPVDVAISVVMIAAMVRIGISAVGALVAIKVFETPMNATALLTCGYYVVTLVAESAVFSRAVQSAKPPAPGHG